MSGEMVAVGCWAMATRFEIVLWGGSEEHLRAAGEEAMAEIGRLDAQLSTYRPDSEISELNACAAQRPVALDPRVFRLLERAAAFSADSSGAFDVTVAPLLRAWGFVGGSGRLPDEGDVAAAREAAGMDLIQLNPADCTAGFLRPNVTVDLGAIGKGYAVEQAAEIVREAGVGGALIHGGTSTVYGVNNRPDGSPWPVAIRHPREPDTSLVTARLRDSALSVSALHGKAFTEGDARYGHVIDPRSGRPVQGALLAAVQCDSATESDALSTALLVLGEPFLEILKLRPGFACALVCLQAGSGTRIVSTGF